MPSHRTGPEPPIGDQNGFAEYYLATSPQTVDAVLRMAAGDRQLAMDAVQDAYVVMLRSWSNRRHRTFEDNRRYVLGIAANKLRDSYRRRRGHVALDDDRDVPVHDAGIAELLDEMSVLSAVRDLIADQPERRRAVAVLYFVEGFEYREIARTLGITESTVRTQVERMRAVLQPYVDKIIKLTRGGGDE